MDPCAPGWMAANRPAESLPAPLRLSRMDTPRAAPFSVSRPAFSGAVADLDNCSYRAIALPSQKP